MAKGKLVAVVVTYNRQAQLRQTLDRLLEAPTAALHAVVVVDNHSTDGTQADLAQRRDPRLVVDRSPANLGGAGGFARAIALARERFDPDWIVVMDDDARPEPDALTAFQLADHGGADAVAAAVRHPDGRICRMNRPTRNPFWHPSIFVKTALGGGRDAFHLTDADFANPQVQPIDGASFVGLFLSRRAMDLGGLPDPALFIYADDAIYTMTLTRRGGRIVFDPGLRFEHDTETLDPGSGRIAPLWKVYYYHRNLLRLYRLAAGPWFWGLLPLWLWSWPRKARHYSPTDRPIFRRMIWRALRDGLSDHRTLPHADVLAMARVPQTQPEPGATDR